MHGDKYSINPLSRTINTIKDPTSYNDGRDLEVEEVDLDNDVTYDENQSSNVDDEVLEYDDNVRDYGDEKES